MSRYDDMSDEELEAAFKQRSEAQDAANSVESRYAETTAGLPPTDTSFKDIAGAFGTGIAKGVADTAYFPVQALAAGADNIERASRYIPQALTNTAGKVLNAFGGLDYETPTVADALRGAQEAAPSTTWMDWADQGKKSLGLENIRYSPKGANPTLDTAHVGGEWMNPFGVTKNLLKKGAEKAGSSVLKNALKYTKKDFKLDAATAAAAATGESFFGDTGQLAGMVPPVLSFLRGKGRSADIKMDQEAMDLIKHNAVDPDKAFKSLKAALARGEKGDLASLTQDAGVAEVLKNYDAHALPEARAQLDEIDNARQTQSQEMLRQQLVKDKATAPELAETAQKRLDTEMADEIAEVEKINTRLTAQEIADETAVNQRSAAQLKAFKQAESTETVKRSMNAEADADEVVKQFKQDIADRNADAVQVTKDFEASRRHSQQNMPENPEAASKELVESRETMIAPLKADENIKYGEFRQVEGKIPGTGIKAAQDSIKKTAAAESESALDNILTHPKVKKFFDLSGPQEPKQVEAYVRKIREYVNSTASLDPQDVALLKVADELDSLLKASVGKGPLKKARAATSLKHEKGGGRHVANSIRKGDEYTAAHDIFRAGPEGVGRAESVLKMDETVKYDMENFILAKGEESNYSDEFFEQHKQFLRRWGEDRPEFTKEIDNLRSGRQKVEGAVATAGDVKKTREADITQTEKDRDELIDSIVDRSRGRIKEETSRLQAVAKESIDDIKKLTKTKRDQIKGRPKTLERAKRTKVLEKFSDRPHATLKKYLTDKDSRKDLKLLRDEFGKTPEGKKAFKAIVGREVQDLMVKQLADGAAITPESIKQFKQMKSSLAEVFTPEEMKDLGTTMSRHVFDAVKRNARSASPAQRSDELRRLSASVGTAMLMAGMSGQQSLVLAGAVRRFLYKGRDGQGAFSEKHFKALRKYLTDPETVINDFDKVGVFEGDKMEAAVRFLTRRLEGASAGRQLHTAAQATTADE